jgi:hypothetical protein
MSSRLLSAYYESNVLLPRPRSNVVAVHPHCVIDFRAYTSDTDAYEAACRLRGLDKVSGGFALLFCACSLHLQVFCSPGFRIYRVCFCFETFVRGSVRGIEE